MKIQQYFESYEKAKRPKNKSRKNTKKDSEKYQNVSEQENDKRQKRLEKDIKILLKQEKKTDVLRIFLG